MNDTLIQVLTIVVPSAVAIGTGMAVAWKFGNRFGKLEESNDNIGKSMLGCSEILKSQQSDINELSVSVAKHEEAIEENSSKIHELGRKSEEQTKRLNILDRTVARISGDR